MKKNKFISFIKLEKKSTEKIFTLIAILIQIIFSINNYDNQTNEDLKDYFSDFLYISTILIMILIFIMLITQFFIKEKPLCNKITILFGTENESVSIYEIFQDFDLSSIDFNSSDFTCKGIVFKFKETRNKFIYEDLSKTESEFKNIYEIIKLIRDGINSSSAEPEYIRQMNCIITLDSDSGIYKDDLPIFDYENGLKIKISKHQIIITMNGAFEQVSWEVYQKKIYNSFF